MQRLGFWLFGFDVLARLGLDSAKHAESAHIAAYLEALLT